MPTTSISFSPGREPVGPERIFGSNEFAGQVNRKFILPLHLYADRPAFDFVQPCGTIWLMGAQFRRRSQRKRELSSPRLAPQMRRASAETTRYARRNRRRGALGAGSEIVCGTFGNRALYGDRDRDDRRSLQEYAVLRATIVAARHGRAGRLPDFPRAELFRNACSRCGRLVDDKPRSAA